VYPFHAVALVAVLGVSILGVLLARRTPKASAIAAFFALWALGSAVVFVVPSPLGDNWTRLRAFVFPLMLLTAALTRFRPRWLAVAALMGALAYNVVPYLMLIPDRADPRPERASFWTPSVDFLRRHVMPLHRVEVVPTASHWEAYWLPKAGIPIARGWYRQLDIVRNPALYKGRLTPARYEAWLRELSVRYVVLPSTRLDPVGGPAEAAVLRSAGFRVAFKAPDATIYEMSGATPLLTGPAPARITAFGHSTIAGSVGAPGRYLLRERYSPYWDIRGRGCISPTPGGMTWLYLHTSGPFSLTVPHGAAAVAQAIGARRVSC
jgi:hypothetical protein